MDRKIQVIIFLLLLLLAPSVYAVAYPQGSDIDIKHPVRVDGYLGTGVLCNISVMYPNGTLLVDFKPMTDNGDYFNYTLNSSKTTIKGDYTYCITCQASSIGSNQTSCFNFLINLGGVDPSQQRTDTTSLSIYFMFGLGILLFIGFIFSSKPPVRYTFFLGALLFFLIAINMIFISLQDEVINSKVEGFFSFFTSISFIFYWFIGSLIFLIWIITFIVNIMKTMEVKKRARYEE